MAVAPNNLAPIVASDDPIAGPNFWKSSLGSAISGGFSDLLRNAIVRGMERRAWMDYMARQAELDRRAVQLAPQINLAQAVNAAGDIGKQVPREYQKALTKVTPTADALLSAAQLRGTARQALSNVSGLQQPMLQSMAANVEGIRRDAAQAARNIGSASALRDITGQVSRNAIGGYAQAAAAAQQAAGQAIGQATQAYSAASPLLDQSRLVQYQLWAKPREAQYTNTGSFMANKEGIYNTPDTSSTLVSLLRQIAGWQGSRGILGLPPHMGSDSASGQALSNLKTTL